MSGVDVRWRKDNGDEKLERNVLHTIYCSKRSQNPYDRILSLIRMQPFIKMEQDDILGRFTLNDTEEITSTGEEIGRGAYGRVFKVNYYGTLCAAKEIHSILLEALAAKN